jgi:mycothiol synthase
MHIVERFELPDTYAARPYRGRADHAAMAEILTAYHQHTGEGTMATAEQFDSNYAHLDGCDPDRDVYVIETGDGVPVAYGRSIVEHQSDGLTGYVFMPFRPDHLRRDLFHAVADGLEAHLLPRLAGVEGSRFQASATHPGPDRPASGESAWFEERGYDARHWGASLVRPNLDDIPERHLPDGVELRPVTEDQLRTIVAAHHECFRDEWGFTEMTEKDYAWIIDDPYRDHTLWKVAWAGDQVVGQVKPFINHDENLERGYRRGYTEYISTHRDWRMRGIAGTLLAWSLQELRDRGMTEAALGVDTNNPGGAFQLYQSLGFELVGYEAVYLRDVGTGGSGG